jgi:glycosyltransferase involved in cell wall biosynthesis
MKKIVFLVLHLGFGGIEKAVISQANMLSDDYEVEIISTYKLYDTPPFEINPNVKITYLLKDLKPNKKEFKDALHARSFFRVLSEGVKSVKILFLRRFTMIKAIKNLDADFIVSSRFLYNSILGKYKPKNTLVFAQEHRHHNDDKKYINKLVSSLKNIDVFLPVSKELTNFYHKKLMNTDTKCIYIPHFLDAIPDDVSNLDEKSIISVARLSPEKGFLDLIDVFKIVNEIYPDWKWHIFGDGEQKEEIIDKIVSLKLQDSIVLHGFQDKTSVNSALEKSSIYMMGSFEESFGLVLIEAQSYGVPCVAFSSAQGAMEIIDNQVNGFLIENRDKKNMAKSILELIEDKEKLKSFSSMSRKNSLKYKKENVKQEWIDLLESFN